jgi:hypothetical protein
MATLFGRHKVADYAKWREVYDAADGIRQKHGVTSHGVYQSADDPSDITIYHEFATIEQAKAMAQDPELHQAIANAGVIGEPDFWFTNKL